MQPQNDHDVLIQVSTKLDTLIGEMQLMRDSTYTRLTNLEQFKVDKADFVEYKSFVDKMILDCKTDIFRTMDERSKSTSDQLAAISKRQDEQEKQISIINRNMYIILGMGILLEILIPVLTRIFFKL